MAMKRMLVDATHPEETRIVVTNGNRLEEFDFESADRRQLRGNIYLAKVTRVEPSLQAAFVEYGGNRHGFLAFSEIHPDYYQIPPADREALEAAEQEAVSEAVNAADLHSDDTHSQPIQSSDNNDDDGDDAPDELDAPRDADAKVEIIGEADDSMDDFSDRPRRNYRKYKIQDVIKRRQVILVQVVKEERGNKGAALTTYLSLAGRYSVLMPNTARGGGISRKITNASDRKRLKEIASELEVPEGMGVILRTAGASRTKAEVTRDFEYLMRLWESVRQLTLSTAAPCLVYEEGSLIKRTIRDLYTKEITEVLVAGDEAYREAKDFMRMIMPAQARNVIPYRDDAPILTRFGIESQLDNMFHPQVTLPSGGYIVINPTEALVSIDVNSGRSTKEHNIEDTALQTNLEAAEEISRQLRLRDLAGLIVIDFIDMEEKRNNRAVERKLKDCLKNDRARIQVGYISHFGLMEMSRQRMRFGVLESSTHVCEACEGTGLVRSLSSLALMIMRAIEENLMKKPGVSLNANVSTDVALYLLNSKRDALILLEHKYGVSITISARNDITGKNYSIEKGEARTPAVLPPSMHIRAESASMDDYDAILADEAAALAEETVVSEELEAPQAPDVEASDEDHNTRNKRRRRRRGRRDRDTNEITIQTEEAVEVTAESETETVEVVEPAAPAEPISAEEQAKLDDEEEQRRKRRRRGRRGGRRNKRGETIGYDENGNEIISDGESDEAVAHVELAEVSDAPTAEHSVSEIPQAEIKPAVSSEVIAAPAQTAETSEPVVEASAQSEATTQTPEEKAAPKPRTPRKRTVKKVEPTEVAVQAESAEETKVEVIASEASDEKPIRKPRAPRKRTPKQESADVTVETPASMPVETPTKPVVAEVANTVVAEEVPTATRAKKIVPSEGIIVSSTSNADEENKPKKAGWWQRRLGLS